MCCRCRSSWTLVSFVDKKGFLLRPSWIDQIIILKGFLRVPSWPFVDKRKLQSPLQFSAALRVLRGQMCCRCCSSWTLVSFVDQKRCSSRPFVDRPNYYLERFSSCSFAALRGQKEVAVAVAVLRGPPCPPRTNVLPLQLFLDLSVLRGQKRFSPPPFVDRPNYYLERFSSCSFAALRGQKEVAVAVAVLRGPPCPPWTNVLPLQFSAALRVLRGQMFCRCRSSRPFVALRGQMCCRCSSPRPSVSSADKCFAVAVLRGPPCPPRTNVLPLQFSAALRVLRGKRCCRCRSSRPFVALRGQMFCRCSSPRPFVDRPNYDLANLSSENRQRALTI